MEGGMLGDPVPATTPKALTAPITCGLRALIGIRHFVAYSQTPPKIARRSRMSLREALAMVAAL